MSNSNTAAFAAEFSLVRQADTNNGQPVVYPQKGISVRIGQVIGRIYFPKGHASRAKSWFFDKIDVIYDSWRSTNWSGWSHNGNPVRVVQFILKPGVCPSLWLDIAKSFVESNVAAVRIRTAQVINALKEALELKLNGIKKVVDKVVDKVQEVVAKTKRTYVKFKKPTPPKPTPQVEIGDPWTTPPQPATSQPATPIPAIPTPQLLLAPAQSAVSAPVLKTERVFTEKDYAFVLKYKPSSVQRICKALKLEYVSAANLAEDLLYKQVDPKEVKGVFVRKKSKK